LLLIFDVHVIAWRSVLVAAAGAAHPDGLGVG
jgi:hypothetical protein